MSIHVPLWLVLVVAILAISIVVAVRDFRNCEGGHFPAFPALGCGALLLGAIGSLAVLLAHAWGWL